MRPSRARSRSSRRVQLPSAKENPSKIARRSLLYTNPLQPGTRAASRFHFTTTTAGQMESNGRLEDSLKGPNGIQVALGEQFERANEVQVAPKLAPSAPKLAPSAPKLAPSASKLAPSAPKLAPSAPRLAPSTTRLAQARPDWHQARPDWHENSY